MEVFKLPMGKAETLFWPEPAGVVFAFAFDGFLHGVRRTHPEEEPDEYLERQAGELTRRFQAGRKKLDKRRRTGSN